MISLSDIMLPIFKGALEFSQPLTADQYIFKKTWQHFDSIIDPAHSPDWPIISHPMLHI